ncbi:MAG: hypothetical protein LQ352_004552 [Teloschistes flavicans]|nr:MAG: hypothetical protein LQ352_004552 [Teloschistes flavicans]
MEAGDRTGEEQILPPHQLYERLSYLAGYTWDQSVEPFHSSYDNWHVFGIQHAQGDKSATTPSPAAVGAGAPSASSKSSPKLGARPTFRHYNTSSEAMTDLLSGRNDQERSFTPVIARVSTHSLRLEREYHLKKAFIQTSDPECNHTVRLISLVRLPPRQSDSGPLAVEIFESPGRNYLRDLTDFGPAWYFLKQHSTKDNDNLSRAYMSPEPRGKLSLATFLDFAVGASECLELLHHGLKVVHGEIRADAFHFNQDTGVVKIVNFGSGPRSFEHAGGLTSAGWSTLSRQTGIKYRLMFIAPEQTGRMSAEPDYRTDLYSLGILFWTMLAGEPAFEGQTPMEMMQAVLSKRLLPISNMRFDILDCLSGIILRMTQKQIDDRYHSASGLRHDLVELKRILGEGDSAALLNFKIGSRDVSSSFVLPMSIMGRSQEKRKIVQAMESIAQRQQSLHQINATRMNSRASTTTSTISDHNDRSDMVEGMTRSSDVSSQDAKDTEPSPALEPVSSTNPLLRRLSVDEPECYDSPVVAEKPPLESNASRDSVQTTLTVDSYVSSSTRNTHRSKPMATVAPRRPTKHRYGHRRRCEVIMIYGSGGLGKSSLIQSTQGEIRRLGYFASAKFDPARKVPYETMLRALSSLFRQIFSESDINTPYHNHIRTGIRPFWSSLSTMLDLPESLVSMEGPGQSRIHFGHPNKALQLEYGDGSTSSLSAASGNCGGSQSMTDFLRGGTSTYSSKCLSIFLEVIRVLATSKMTCLSFDDLQFADEESVDLICNIIGRKLGLLIIFTCREAEQIPRPLRSMLEKGTANLTTITLVPLSEEEVIDYVSATLVRPREYVLSLAVVCLEKTNGNPFYLKQMLEVCHRKGCLWYSWKDSAWEFDLDRVFAEFESESYGDQLNTSFISKRLQDLPATARAILAWGSLLGSTFSFSLVQELFSGAFDRVEDSSDQRKPDEVKESEIYSAKLCETAVEGLQAATQAYILMPTGDEDQFSFSHDRYLQASASLQERQDVESMHFYIAQTLMKYSNTDSHSLYARAEHICQAKRLIKDRVQHRSRYREILSQAAQRAIDSGARPTALQYYLVCFSLLQPNPWHEGPDVYYDETLDIFTRAAQLHWHQGLPEPAMQLAAEALEATSVASDRAPVWIITSRLLSQQGDIAGAFQALKTSIIELGVEWEKSLTLEVLDTQFDELRRRVQEADQSNTLVKPLLQDPARACLGAVLAEAISAAFWSDATMFYQVASTMLHQHMAHENMFPQMGLGFCYFAMIAVVRKLDIPFAIQCEDCGRRMLEEYKDSYTYGRGLALNAMFIEGFRSPIREHIPIFEEAIQHAQVSGDKHLLLLSHGLIASCRLWQGDDMAEIENYCMYAAEDFGDWSKDVRGGTYLTAVR